MDFKTDQVLVTGPVGWLGSRLVEALANGLEDVETVKWFKKNFEQVGKMTVPEFVSNMELIVKHLRDKLGSHLIVMNTLVIEPLSPTHNFQLLNEDHVTRKRAFNIALAELSRSQGFHVIDVDRILKENGVRDQVDFAHFPVEGKLPVAREAFRQRARVAPRPLDLIEVELLAPEQVRVQVAAADVDDLAHPQPARVL